MRNLSSLLTFVLRPAGLHLLTRRQYGCSCKQNRLIPNLISAYGTQNEQRKTEDLE